MLKKIVLALVVIVAIAVVVVMMQPDTYRVERSAQISAPADVVWAEISDFKQWNGWGHWQKSDPEQKVVYGGEPGAVGHSASWDGEKTGKGTMTIREATKPTRLRIRLDFAEPMQSQADTEFNLETDGNGVTVTWSMRGENDFMGKLFGLIMGMEEMIGSAYEQSLADLKTVAESKAK